MIPDFFSHSWPLLYSAWRPLAGSRLSITSAMLYDMTFLNRYEFLLSYHSMRLFDHWWTDLGFSSVSCGMHVEDYKWMEIMEQPTTAGNVTSCLICPRERDTGKHLNFLWKLLLFERVTRGVNFFGTINFDTCQVLECNCTLSKSNFRERENGTCCWFPWLPQDPQHKLPW